jgi:citrate synthase
MTPSLWLTAEEAAAALRITRATLYAYVSRGRIRSQSSPGSSRARAYSREDVERLRRRTEERRDPDKAAAHTLQRGMPVLESAITLIDGHALYYRGHDATVLARTRTFEEVASLIWTGGLGTPSPAARPWPSAERQAAERAARALPFAARAQAMLANMSANDPTAVDVRPTHVAATGWRILRVLTAAVAPEGRS